MGTHSITYIHEKGEKSPVITAIYRHYDGYFSGMGADLKKFLEGFNIVNGLGMQNPEKTANGMNCLAAQIIAHFKTEPGGIYIYRPNAEKEEFCYHVFMENGKVRVSGYSDNDAVEIL